MTTLAVLAVVVTVHVAGPSTGSSTPACFLRLPAKVAGGGSEVYCLKTFEGEPGPNAVVRDKGVMTFSLRRGTLTARVSIVQRFAPDGKHARQSLTGTITRGTRAYAGAGGTISGGGTDTEDTPGHLAASDLTYRIRLRG
jgi:hypothetical protein